MGGGGGAFFERGTCFLLWPKGEGTYLGEFPYWSKYGISSSFSWLKVKLCESWVSGYIPISSGSWVRSFSPTLRYETLVRYLVKRKRKETLILIFKVNLWLNKTGKKRNLWTQTNHFCSLIIIWSFLTSQFVSVFYIFKFHTLLTTLTLKSYE